MNKVWLQGKVGKDADVRQTKNGKPFVSFVMATERTVQQKKVADWHEVTVWGDRACPLRKGQDVIVKGEYVTDSWVDQQSSQRRYKQKVSAFSLEVEPWTPGTTKPEETYNGGHNEDDIPW